MWKWLLQPLWVFLPSEETSQFLLFIHVIACPDSQSYATKFLLLKSLYKWDSMNWVSYSRGGLVQAKLTKIIPLLFQKLTIVQPKFLLTFAESIFLLTPWVKTRSVKYASVYGILPMFYSSNWVFSPKDISYLSFPLQFYLFTYLFIHFNLFFC